MSKMRKRFLPVLLAASMVCGSVSPAYAADLFSADEEDIAAESVEFNDESAGAAKENEKVLTWDYGNAHSVTVEVGTELTLEQFIDQTNAKNCVKSNGVLTTDNITVSANEWHWGLVNTSNVGKYDIDLYASDNSGNITYNMGLSVIVQDTTAPQWNYSGNINYTITVPVGTELMSAEEFITASNVKNNVSDNSGEVPTITYNEWAWGQIDTNVVKDHRIEVYATDAWGNTSYNIGITLSVADGEAPVWNYNGITHALEIPVGTELTAEEFITMTGADVNVSDNYTSVENIKIEPDSWQWKHVFDTSKTGKFTIDLYAYDESKNRSYNVGITVKVVDKIAPVWNYGGITHALEIPVGTELTATEFIAMTDANVNVSDNYTSVENIKIEPDSWQWKHVFDTSKTGKFTIDLYAYDESGNKSYNLGITVNVVPATKKVKVVFVLAAENKEVGTPDVVEVGFFDSKLTVNKETVKVPEGYVLSPENAVVTIPTDNELFVPVAVAQKDVTVHFVLGTENKEVGTPDVVKVGFFDTKLTVNKDTVKVPEGYVLSPKNAVVTIPADNELFVPVAVAQKDVTVHFVLGTENKEVGTPDVVKVGFFDTKLTVNKDTVKVPEGYVLSPKNAVVTIPEDNVVIVPVAVAQKDVTIIFKTKYGETVEKRSIKVGINTKYIKVSDLTAPEKCVITSTGIAYFDKNGKTTVWVKRTTKTVTITYKTTDGKVVTTKTQEVPANAKTVNVKAPDGYKLVRNKTVVEFNTKTNTVTVYVTRTSRNVTVYFKNINRTVVGSKDMGKINMDINQINISKLTAPAGYTIIGKGYADIDSNGNAYVRVARSW